MKTNLELVRFCNSKLGTPYVYGMKGNKLTRELLNELSRQYPRMFTEQYRQKAEKYIGKACTDCSGLISWCTGVLRGSSEYRETAAAEKNIGELNESMIGWALWKSGHIGVYIGGGYCIEARGINYGTIKVLVSSNNWQKVIKLKDIEYVKVPAAAKKTVSEEKKAAVGKTDGNGDSFAVRFLERLLAALKK